MLPFLETRDTQIFTYHFRDFSFPTHLHDGLELIEVTQGNIHMQHGRKNLIVSAGQITVVSPGELHSYETNIAQHNEGNVYIFSSALLQDFQFLLHGQSASPVTYLLADLPEDIASALFVISDPSELFYVKKAYIQVLLCRLIPHLKTEPLANQPDEQLLRIIQYMTTHYTEPLTLSGLASHIHIDRYQLSRTFSLKLHCSFTDYINRLRLEHARGLLLSSRKQITEIAFESGFESIRSFNRNFRQQYGQSPSIFRKQSHTLPNSM